MRQVGAMRVYFRVFGVLCSPLLLAAALAHAPLEQLTSADIEHNLKIEKKIGRVATVSLEDGAEEVREALQPRWNCHSGEAARRVSSDPVATCSEARSDQMAQSLCTLETIRLVV
jgi:hypothetical protein